MSESFVERIKQQEEGLRRFDPRPFSEILKERAMPKPLWAQRPMTDSGSVLEEQIVKAAAASPADAFCIYIHVPYCRTRCGYCDCYSFPLTPSRLPDLAVYPGLLEKEISWWGRNVPSLREKRLSTIHFGGGTPLMVGTEGLARVVETVQNFFKVKENTELALESTSSDLNEKVLDDLMRLGFTRLHIGVQSLRDPVRRAIGRRESGLQVLRKIRYAVESGWAVSSDIIIGLPQYGEEDIAADVEEMMDAGVEGLSIYELVRSPRNRAFFERHGLLDPDITAMWRQYQYAFWLSENAGCSLKIYNHMAKGRDDNRYFTSPSRGEDLLSFGTIADGYFGEYLYRHAELPEYRSAVEQGYPGFLGGMLRTETESRVACLEREIRGGRPDPEPFIRLLGPEKALTLFQNWIGRGYLRVSADGESTELLPNGSWFIMKMIDDITPTDPRAPG
ncbi:MAG: radical SAM protein [Flexilinea sp.]|nr:radical SAM protein [Flexilinea sp.]